MSFNLWLAYVAAVFVISGTPGPNMLLSMTHGIHHGLTRTFSTMLGLLVGIVILLSLSLGGLGAVLLASPYALKSSNMSARGCCWGLSGGNRCRGRVFVSLNGEYSKNSG